MTLFSTNNDMNMGESISFFFLNESGRHVESLRLSIYIQCLSSLTTLCYDFTPWITQIHRVVGFIFGEFNKLSTADIFCKMETLLWRVEKRDEKNEKQTEKNQEFPWKIPLTSIVRMYELLSSRICFTDFVWTSVNTIDLGDLTEEKKRNSNQFSTSHRISSAILSDF